MGEDSRGDFAGPGVQVLLAGTATHRAGTGLPSVAAVRTSLTEAAGALTECCGVAPESLRVLTDPADPAQLGSALTEAAEQATSVLLFYYIGHGLVSAAGELHLATMATEDASRGLGYTALPFTAVREVLSGCRARAIVIVLDCCSPAARAARSARAATTGWPRRSSGVPTCWPPRRMTSRPWRRPETGAPRSPARWLACYGTAIRAARAGSPWATCTVPWPSGCPPGGCPARAATRVGWPTT